MIDNDTYRRVTGFPQRKRGRKPDTTVNNTPLMNYAQMLAASRGKPMPAGGVQRGDGIEGLLGMMKDLRDGG